MATGGKEGDDMAGQFTLGTGIAEFRNVRGFRDSAAGHTRSLRLGSTAGKFLGWAIIESSILPQGYS